MPKLHPGNIYTIRGIHIDDVHHARKDLVGRKIALLHGIVHPNGVYASIIGNLVGDAPARGPIQFYAVKLEDSILEMADTYAATALNVPATTLLADQIDTAPEGKND